MEMEFALKRGIFAASLLLSLFTACDHAKTNKPKCDSISTSIVKTDTFTTEIKCSEDGYRRVTRKTNGREDGQWEAYGADGTLEELSHFKKGEADGLFQIWHPDGTPYDRKFYRNGHLSDTARLWYDNGKLNSLDVYDTAGRRNGWSMNWDDRGILLDSVYHAENEMKEAFYFWESGKLMFHEKTIGNPQTHRYDIREAASFDSTGTKNGEVENGNGRLIVLHTRGFSASDTLEVKGTVLQDAGESFGYFALSLFPAHACASLRAEHKKTGTDGPDCNSMTTSIVKKDTLTTEIRYDDAMVGGWKVIRKKNGKEDGRWEDYNSDGKPVLVSNYRNGQEDGIYEGWWESGFPFLYEPYRNGNRVGVHKEWYRKDKLKSVRSYNAAGQMHGWSINWAENGNLEDSIYYVNDEKNEGFFFWKSGKLMLSEKTRWNPGIKPYDGYYHGPYDILEAASFDSTGKQNGEVKGGNGRIIMLSACSGTDTLEVKDTHVRKAGYFDGHLDVNFYGQPSPFCTE